MNGKSVDFQRMVDIHAVRYKNELGFRTSRMGTEAYLAEQGEILHSSASSTSLRVRLFMSLLENEKNGRDQEEEADQVIPAKRFIFENENCNRRKNHERYGFLQHFQLP